MSKKHLTLSDRIIVQTGLQQHLSLAAIAEKTGVSRSTVSREIKARRKLVKTSKGNSCIHRGSCIRIPDCRSTCFHGKRQCQSACCGCNEGCTEYQEEFCADYEQTPYTCNGCDKRLKCRLRRMIYDAQTAQEQYENLLSESRKGISLTEEELAALNDFVTPKIKAGLSIPMICNTFRDQVPVSDTTLYSYVESGLLEARNLDLRRKASRPKREKSGPVLRVDRKCHIGRTYDEYNTYMEENPDQTVSQMDSVIIHKGGQVILTVLFTNCDLQLMFLREHNTSSSVSAVFADLHNKLGYGNYKQLFQVILTDRGSEFTDPVKIEASRESGEIMCRVFYCDPQNSNQKSNCERNHEFIRYIIPKNKGKENYTSEEIRSMMNHINSYPRKKWNGQAPIDLFKQIYGEEVSTLLGLEKIPSNSINLTPALLK